MGARTSCLPTSIVQRGLPPPWERRQVGRRIGRCEMVCLNMGYTHRQWGAWFSKMDWFGSPRLQTNPLSGFFHMVSCGYTTFILLISVPNLDNSQLGDRSSHQESNMWYVDCAWSPRSPQDVRYFMVFPWIVGQIQQIGVVGIAVCSKTRVEIKVSHPLT